METYEYEPWMSDEEYTKWLKDDIERGGAAGALGAFFLLCLCICFWSIL